MGVVLYRVDERLIHGQVVIGWGRRLDPQCYVVVDDDLAAQTWEQELYRLALDGAQIRFLTVAEARGELPALQSAPERTLLLTRDVAHMARLAAGGLMEGTAVNLGGVHHRPGRTEVRSYLHLDEEDREALRALAAEGVTVSGQDLPEASRVQLEALLS
ncbi:MAG: PTS sugar transporter subunit IIB [Longimicrobiales bacterium]|nr:PTS sugar transporter subunit IIB [Longimicrobiales bacterium]